LHTSSNERIYSKVTVTSCILFSFRSSPWNSDCNVSKRENENTNTELLLYKLYSYCLKIAIFTQIIPNLQQTFASSCRYKDGASSHCSAIFSMSCSVKPWTFLAAQPWIKKNN
jgi:hypothetical protein